jgi:beta-aspartyl-dipeptidase (metallo-type)
MLTSIERGKVFGPEKLGTKSVLIVGARISSIGDVDTDALRKSGIELCILSAEDCFVVPGFIDPHAHLIGAGGEQGFASRLPEMSYESILRAGITTIVGCLGTDSVTRTLRALLGKVREFEARGLTAFLYTGAFQVPTSTLTGDILNDLVLIDKIVGIGEVAIADARSSQPTAHEMARLAATGYQASLLTGKAGVLHLHAGPTNQRLKILHEVLDHYNVLPRQLYPTHVTRTPELLRDAANLAKHGSFVDTDVVEEGLPDWLKQFEEFGGPLDRFTVSSDAHTVGGSPEKFFHAFQSCLQAGLPMEKILPCFTRNTADALALKRKGGIAQGADGDLLVIDRRSLALRHIVARGKPLLVEGKLTTEAK